MFGDFTPTVAIMAQPEFTPTVAIMAQPDTTPSPPVTEEPNYALWGGLGVGTLLVVGGGAALAWYLLKGRTENPGTHEAILGYFPVNHRQVQRALDNLEDEGLIEYHYGSRAR